MRRFLLCGTAALALSSAPVTAGGLIEPAMEPEVVATQTRSSSAGILIPILILVLIAAAVASGGSNGGDQMTEMASDRRIKTDCTWVGMSKDSIPVWRYRYTGTPQVFEGVMAQDVAMRRPDAAVMWPNGLMAVNYSRLGTPLRLVA